MPSPTNSNVRRTFRSSAPLLLAGLCAFFLYSNTPAVDTFHHAKPVPKANYDSLFAAAVPLEESTQAQELLQRCVDRYGGNEHLRALESFRLHYTSKRYMTRDSVEVVKTFRRDRKYKIFQTKSKGPEARILNGARAWFQSPDTLLTIDSGRYRAELFSYLTLAMPLALIDESFDEIRFGRRDGDPLSYFYASKTDSLLIVVGVDPSDPLVASSEGVVYQGDSNFTFVNQFTEFREVSGYWFPFELVNISMGLKVAESRLVDVDVNPRLEETEFLPEPR